MQRAGLGYDLERLVDDFVLLCYFVGNDFLPHLPALDIRTGALDAMLRIYKRHTFWKALKKKNQTKPYRRSWYHAAHLQTEHILKSPKLQTLKLKP